jgi:anti-sigma factor RsiW
MSFQDEHDWAQERALLRLGPGEAGEERLRAERHLGECPACARAVGGFQEGLALLRSIAVPADRALVARTRLRVRERAEQWREEHRRRVGLAASGLLVAFLTALSSAGVWRALAWAGSYLALPPAAWIAAGVWLWFLPAVLAGIAALVVRDHRSGLPKDGMRGGVWT